MPCPRTLHPNNVPRLRGEKHDISLKILHQAGFKTARQAATSTERYALTIAPCPSLHHSDPDFKIILNMLKRCHCIPDSKNILHSEQIKALSQILRKIYDNCSVVILWRPF